MLDEAVSLRGLSPGELHVVHVTSTPWGAYSGAWGVDVPVAQIQEDAERWLAEVLAGVPGAVGRVQGGWPPRVACEYAAAEAIDLLVAAAHRGMVQRAMLGGFASYVSYKAPCPVLLVHPAEPAGPEG